jgi:hypothetical protein
VVDIGYQLIRRLPAAMLAVAALLTFALFAL